MLHVGAIGLDVLAELFGDFAVAFQEVFARHAFLAGCAAGGDDVFSVLEGLCHVGRGYDVYVAETALAHFFCHAFSGEHVVEADV